MAKDGTADSDLLIVGGGLVGQTMAIAAAVAGLTVVLVDREPPAGQLAEPYDGRSSAIARGSQQALEGLGIWPLMADRTQPITDIRVSDGRAGPLGETGWAATLFLHYGSDQVGGVPLGYIVENRVTREALTRRLEALPTILRLAPDRLAVLERSGAGVSARTESGTAISARLVIAADGRGSMLRRDAGIGVQSWDYPQSGIVCSVGHELPHEGVAHEHFLPAGPFAMLPMIDGPLVSDGVACHRSSLVWTERREVAEKVMTLDDAAFAEELTRRFGDSLGRLEVRGRRWCYPLSLSHAERYRAVRLALIGDAAHAIHPIAGQGLNLGIRDVAALAEVLVDAARLGLDIGQEDHLARYERWRRFDATALVAATDGLNRLFSNDLAPVRVARDLGLAAVDRLPAVKRLFMRHAMGLLGDLPRLVRGEPL
jgi:2-octaprenyl-6-methoxyphenol hydroxylase